ncbi:50S ribosome-binding GTPase [Candidatus Woesearchaeota archaeon]|nr:50S ribosome-binding GTPase [Candidatus Woesearchaeota archaeon]
MNFQSLKKIESHDFYLDVAFRRATKKVKEKTIREHDRLKKAKMLEEVRINTVRNTLTEPLNKILLNFPSLDNLDIFYQELIRCTLDYKDLKKSLGSVKWAVSKINLFSKEYLLKIKKSVDHGRIRKLRIEYYGRISSILKQIKKYLSYLEESRKIMKSYPAVKTSVFTVCIFGFPNVGKSTLLSRITDASPEINAYAFTTKRLNLGYINLPGNKIQIIDTPGTLNRPDKMNDIELQAYLVVKHLADLIVYVFDPTPGNDMKDQKSLLLNVAKYKKKVLTYLSKQDIADKKTIYEFQERFKEIIINPSVLKEKIIELSKESKI